MDKKSMADQLKMRGHIRNAMDDMAKELGFAVNDLRHELVERPWFGREVTDDIDPFEVKDLDPDVEEALYGKDYSQEADRNRDAVYGRYADREPDDGMDRDRDDGIER